MAGAFVDTTIQLGLLIHAGVVMTALKLVAALNTRDRAIDAGSSRGRSVTKGTGSCNLIRGWAAMKFAGLCTLFLAALQTKDTYAS